MIDQLVAGVCPQTMPLSLEWGGGQGMPPRLLLTLVLSTKEVWINSMALSSTFPCIGTSFPWRCFATGVHCSSTGKENTLCQTLTF